MPPPLLQVTRPNGIYLPEADLWLDPHFSVERAFISHAHSDHVARHGFTICSELTRDLMRARYALDASHRFHTPAMCEPHDWEDWQIQLLPAGHIIGSAMLHLTRRSDGASLLYTGDYKLRQGLSCEPCQLTHAGTLIMETTFGLPHFHFPPTPQVIAEVLKFVRETLEDGGIPVLLGYSLGKAQEILCALRHAGFPVMLHRSVFDLTRVVAPMLGDVPDYRLFDAAEARGHVLIFPPSGARSLALRRLKICRTAMLTGWALQPGAKYRYQVDAIFPLSDHADYPQLIQTVETVQPRRVYLVHGYTQEFAADLRRRGYEAWTLEAADQIELRLERTEALPAGAAAAADTEAPADSGDHWPAESFARWCLACAQTAAESSRLKKTALLANCLHPLDDADLALAARYFSGLLFDPAAGEAPINTGWAVIRRALQELTNIRDAEYRAIARSQADAGRTAYLILSRRPTPGTADTLTLQDLDVFLRALRDARGPQAKTDLLRNRLAVMSPHAGSWLVRLLTGELRMGSREGLIEEAIAAAFEEKADAVREAAMLCGDIGRAAVLAKGHVLHEAQPRLLVPIKVMLASPEETAEAVWQRLAGDDAMGDHRVWLEDKFDGIRAQVHHAAGKAEIFTRDLKPIGNQFPEIIRAALQLPGGVILDGEIIAHAEGRRLSFFDLQKRLGRRDQADLFLPSDISVRYIIFDALWAGEPLLGLPLRERRARLETLPLPPEMLLADVHQAASSDDIEAAFLAARRRGNEGLIAKDPASLYTPGRRGKAWLKLKKAFSTLDVVVVRAEQGHGKRSHVLSDYTFAVRDDAGALRIIGKAYSGLTDAEIEELTEHFTRNTLHQRGSVRSVLPDTVLEIAFDSIQPSTRHDSGLALRFPRIKAIRRDKTPSQIDTLDYARRLAGLPEPAAALKSEQPGMIGSVNSGA